MEREQVGADITPHQTANSVLAVLAGAPLNQAAADVGIAPDDLADAVETYQAAGVAALGAQAATRDWYQVSIQFTDRAAADHTGSTHLGPFLKQAESTGLLTAWWFIRKTPNWRLRLRPGPATAVTDMQAAVDAFLNSLADAGLIDRWRRNIYEPEAVTFGGPQAMDIAHDLFHADSRSILGYLPRHDLTTSPARAMGRRELSILLCSALFRGAQQEWHEQGDIWHRVTQMRPLPPDVPTDRLHDMTSGLRRLMTVDTTSTSTLFGATAPLGFAAPWFEAFKQAGHELGASARHGELERGIRNVLAHHVIFHWNRLGLPSRTQAILAGAARDTVMSPPDGAHGCPPAGR